MFRGTIQFTLLIDRISTDVTNNINDSNMHNIRALKLKQQNGMQRSLI